MGDYPSFLGSPARSNLAIGIPGSSILFLSAEGPWHLDSQSVAAPEVLSANPLFKSLRLGNRAVSSAKRFTTWLVKRLGYLRDYKSSVFSSQNRSIIAWSLSDLHPCSHLGTLWRPPFVELPLRKIMIVFYEYLDAKRLHLLERGDSSCFLKLKAHCKKKWNIFNIKRKIMRDKIARYKCSNI